MYESSFDHEHSVALNDSALTGLPSRGVDSGGGSAGDFVKKGSDDGPTDCEACRKTLRDEVDQADPDVAGDLIEPRSCAVTGEIFAPGEYVICSLSDELERICTRLEAQFQMLEGSVKERYQVEDTFRARASVLGPRNEGPHGLRHPGPCW